MQGPICSVCLDSLPFGASWPRLEELEALVAFEQGGTYRAAAAVIGVSHSVVRDRVRSLSERLGVDLADRDGLTATGRALVAVARADLARMAAWC